MDEINLNITNDVNVQFNTVPLHGRPLAKNVASNILYKTLMPDEDGNDIITSFHPVVIQESVS